MPTKVVRALIVSRFDYLYLFCATGQATSGNIRGSFTVTGEIEIKN